MIIESLDDCKRLKQLLGLIQSSTLPPLKGIDAFCIHNSCEWIFEQCVKFEKLESENKNVMQEIKEVIEQLPIEKPKKRKSKKKVR
jgi:hypothetical protein